MKTYPFVKQIGIKDCGPACLLMIIKYYHGNISLEKLKLMCNTTKDGTSAYDIVKTANKLGFKTEAYRLNIDSLFNEEIKLPCIAHTILDNKYLHYVVIYKIEKDKITFADPSKKIMTLSKFEFDKIFNSVIITFKPIKEIKKEDNFDLKKLTLNTLKLSKIKLIILWILSIVLIIISLIILLLMKTFMNNVEKLPIITIALILYTFLVIIKYFLIKYQNILRIILTNEIDYQLTTNVYSNIFHLPYQYYCHHETGEIIKRVNDITKAKSLIVFVLTSFLIHLPLSILSMLVLGHINKILLLICIFNCILDLFFIIKHKQKNINDFELIHSKEENINSYLYTTISNINTIKGINLEHQIINKFKKKYISYIKDLSNTIKHYLLKRETIELINNITNGFLLFIGCILIKQKNIDIIQLFTFLFIKDFLYIPITNLQENNIEIKEGITTLKRIQDLKGISVIEENNNIIFKDSIYIKKVNHKYKTKKININCHLHIKKGEKIFLTGQSGSGKTTLLNQIYKNIPSYKNIYIDNKDISSIDESTIKNNIIILNSNNFILPDTIDNNLFIDDIKKRNKIKEICDINIDENVNAMNLSDGEKQKLSLGRAIAKDKEIFIFDEALNKIDINSERIILKNLFNYFKDKTFIIVSHRMNNIDLFDKVVKIKNNNIEILKRR